MKTTPAHNAALTGYYSFRFIPPSNKYLTIGSNTVAEYIESIPPMEKRDLSQVTELEEK